MLAIKLHKRRRPWLGKGSHLIPIVSWEAARVHLREWIRTLESSRPAWYPNSKINYLTLVRIPPDLPVEIRFLAASDERASTLPVFMEMTLGAGGGQTCCLSPMSPLRDHPPEVKRALAEHENAQRPQGAARAFPGRPFACWPELVLGRALPRKCVVWTKEVRDVRRASSRKAIAENEADES